MAIDETQSLASVALLVRVIDEGSISAAARSLGLPKSTVSRRLTALERDLGRALLRRSTRALTLTDAGRRLFDAAGPSVRDALAAERALRAEGDEVIGTVRVSATSAYARVVLLPQLCDFMAMHPGVRIDLDVDDHRVRIVPTGVDLAIRLGELEDAALFTRRIGHVQRLFVASPDYLRTHGAPGDPPELMRHNAVVTSASLTKRAFADGTQVDVPWRMSVGTMELALDAARAGFGIALLPDFLAEPAIADGTLVEVLAAHREPEVTVSALYPPSTPASPAPRALLDHLTAKGPS